MSFYPENYERKEAPSDYMRMSKEGDYRIRILRNPIMGFETWTSENGKNVPHRARTFEEGVNLPSKDGKVKEFHAFIIWDYQSKMVRLLNVTQSGIQDSIYSYSTDADWGDPKNYDLVIKRTGLGFNDTKYTVISKPVKPLDQEIVNSYKEVRILEEEYFKGGHPIIRNKKDSEQPVDENSDIAKDAMEALSNDSISEDVQF